LERVEVACVAVFKDSKVLLVKSSCGLWEIPGGSIERGETEEEAAVREVLEETEIKVLSMVRVGVYTFKSSGKTVFITLFASNEWEKAEGKRGERAEVKWLDIEELDKLRGELVNGTIQMVNNAARALNIKV